MDLFADVKALVVGALGRLAEAGRLPQGLDLAAVTVEPPRDPAHGDMATNAAMVLARPAGMAPRDIAEALAGALAGAPGIVSADGGGAGLPEPAAGAGALVRGDPRRRWRRGRTSAGPRRAPGGGSTSSSSRPTRPGRCTWATCAARSSATRWPGSSTSPGTR